MRELICVLGIGVFAAIASLNAVLVFRRSVLRQQRVPSMIPVIGGLIGFATFSFAPWPAVREVAYLPLLLDIGTGPYLLLALVIASRAYFSERLSRVVVTFEATNLVRRRAVLELRNNGSFRLELTWQRRKGEFGVGKWPVLGRWNRQNDEIVLSAARGKIVLSPRGDYLVQSQGLVEIEKSSDTSLQNAQFVCVKGSLHQPAA